MGRFTDETESKGFLKELLQKLQTNLNAEQVKIFENLDNDEARFKFVLQDPNLKEFTVSRNASIKNVELALDFKQKGNNAFQSQNWKLALDFYNKGLLLLPDEHGEYCIYFAFSFFCLINRHFFTFQKTKNFRFYWQIVQRHFIIWNGMILLYKISNWLKKITPPK